MTGRREVLQGFAIQLPAVEGTRAVSRAVWDDYAIRYHQRDGSILYDVTMLVALFELVLDQAIDTQGTRWLIHDGKTLMVTPEPGGHVLLYPSDL